MFTWQPWAVPLLLSAVASLLAARVIWHRCGTSPAATALVVLVLGAALWSGMRGAGMLFADLAQQSVFSLLIYPGVCAVVLGLYCHARALTDRRWTWNWRRHWWLLIEPALCVVLALTNPTHGLFRSDFRLEGDPPILYSEGGPFFQLHTWYSYALLGAAFAVLLRGAFRVSATHRRRFVLPIVGGLFPTAGNVLSVVIVPDFPVDLTSILFLVTATTCAWAMLNSALPDVLPIALSQVVATIGDAVLVVDRQQRIVEVNPAADTLLRALTPQVLPSQAPAKLVGTCLREIADPMGPDPSTTRAEQRTVAVERLDRHLDLRTAPLTDSKGACIGWVLVARDVTQALRQQADLERQRAEAVAASEALREQLDLVEQLRRELAEQATRDPLTGLFNRRRMVDFLSRDVPAALTGGHPVSLLMMDVDKFKAVNDTHGHTTGDAVLTAVACALSEGLRAEELLARFGGEEFVLVLPGVTLEEALARAEVLRARCAQVEVGAPDGTRVRTTISIGAAGLVPSTQGPGAWVSGARVPDTNGLLLAADGALYAAKAGGRNRVVSSGVLTEQIIEQATALH
ncbi:diguanylate cyclase (GGDEF)-like protein [Kineococcus radiotolerans]|uniref:Diguanylate cyclase (GGDEF)-like protein n=1 Tax=Kineococcus radiotolerans TaxID=131568 RepID=A0A7W4THW7_KINRA|nr:diguanylate cyclase [Kineococcus radiotolerans]MBB2899219.1 diguanylate cyclase (GGDEF)-like protein [Kineococcus radiotolerans]